MTMQSSSANGAPVAPSTTRQGVSTTVAALLGLTFGPSVIAVLTFGVFVPAMRAEFGWSPPQMFLAATIVSYMIMLASPLQGFLTDRFGARRVILTSIPLFAAGLAAFYFLPANRLAYYVFWGALPLLAVGLWPLAYLKAVSGWFDRKLGLALGIANGGIGVGSTLMPIFAGWLIANYGWRSAFVVIAALVLVVSWPIVFFFLRDPYAKGSAAPEPPAWGTPYKDAIKSVHFMMLAVAFVLLGFSTTALITQQVPMLIDAGWTPKNAGYVQAVFGVGLMVGRLGVGYLIDRIFAPYVMAAVAIGGAIGCALYATMAASNLAYLSSLLIGLVVGAEFDVLALLIKRYFGPKAFGKLYGVIFAVFQLATGIGILVLANMSKVPGGFSRGFWLFAVVLTLAAVAFVMFKPYVYGRAPVEADKPA